MYFLFSVYDQTIPIINLIDIFTIGVTVAMAWALPSDPLYKITEQLFDNYKKEETKRIDEIKGELIKNKMDSNVANIEHVMKNTTLNRNDVNVKDDGINHIYLTPLNWNQNDWKSVINRYHFRIFFFQLIN